MTDQFVLWNTCLSTQSVAQRPETVTETTVLVRRLGKAGGHKRLRLAQVISRKTVSPMIDVKYSTGLRVTPWHIYVIE